MIKVQGGPLLQGKTALVTGGGSGVGAAVARSLAGNGACVWVTGRRRENLEAVASEIASVGGEAHVLVADLSSEDSAVQIASALGAAGAHVDILVHSAATFVRATVEDLQASDLDEAYRTNVRAPVLLTQALLGDLKTARGEVVFVNSSSGHTAKPTTSVYDATKHALRAFADSLRAEVNGEGVRVLSVYLGRTASEMQAAVHAWEGKAYRPELLLQPEDVAAVILNALMLPRTAEVTDLHIRPMQKS